MLSENLKEKWVHTKQEILLKIQNQIVSNETYISSGSCRIQRERNILKNVKEKITKWKINDVLYQLCTSIK